MASSPAAGNALRPLRLPRIVELLREQPLPAEVILPRLNRRLKADGIPEISIRTLQHDLDWLLEHLGAAGIERVAKADLKPEPPGEFHRFRLFYRLKGAEDLIPITGDLVFLTEMEALALVAARAQLATPPTPGAKVEGAGPLADAIDTLIRRLGLVAKDGRVPDVLAVTQAAPQPYQPAHVLAILRAIRLGEAVAMDYRPLGKPPHAVTAQPVKLVLVEGEPYLWAWDSEAKKLKNYKVARVETVAHRAALPDVPAGLETEVKGNLLGGFRGVAGQQQRGRVVVRLTPTGVPHVRHRKLGGNQNWNDLPDGGARVSFNTSGMDAVKHWLLQCGGEAVVESPAELVAWFRTETERMAEAYRLGGGAGA
jgi:predicted DNA-binding transcriptional regulator YafY